MLRAVDIGWLVGGRVLMHAFFFWTAVIDLEFMRVSHVVVAWDACAMASSRGVRTAVCVVIMEISLRRLDLAWVY